MKQMKYPIILSRTIFNWRKPFTYCIVYLYQTVALLGASYCVSSVLYLFMGFCWILLVFIEDIERDLYTVNEKFENYTYCKGKLCQFIELHSIAKKLSYCQLRLNS